jgi:hypothetical protein
MEKFKIRFDDSWITISIKTEDFDWKTVGKAKRKIKTIYNGWEISVAHPFTDIYIELYFEYFKDRNEWGLVEIDQYNCGGDCDRNLKITKVKKSDGCYKLKYLVYSEDDTGAENIEKRGKIVIKKVGDVETVSPSDIIEMLAEKIKKKTEEAEKFTVAYNYENGEWWFKFFTDNYDIVVYTNKSKDRITLSEIITEGDQWKDDSEYTTYRTSYISEYSNNFGLIKDIIEVLKSLYQIQQEKGSLELLNKK